MKNIFLIVFFILIFPLSAFSATLKDALNEALRDWVTNVDDTFYIIGTVAGPSPYPELVRDFQAIIGREVIQQMEEIDKNFGTTRGSYNTNTKPAPPSGNPNGGRGNFFSRGGRGRGRGRSSGRGLV